MDPVSAIASVVGVVQFSLSAAKVLNQYVGDYRGAERDVRDLASEVERTFRQVDELQCLIKQNETTNRFSESNLRSATICCIKAQELGELLWDFLKKTNGDMPKDREVEEKDIQLSLFGRAKWPQAKPWVEEMRGKSSALKYDIMIILQFAALAGEYVSSSASRRWMQPLADREQNDCPTGSDQGDAA